MQTFSHYPAVPPPMPLRLKVIDEGRCPYLPSRQSTTRALWASSCADDAYELLLDSGFRRSGRVIYQQTCAGCRRCVSMRVDTQAFTPSRWQRRVLRRNADLKVAMGLPTLTAEKLALYQQYLRAQHPAPASSHGPSDPPDPPTAGSSDELSLTLYDSPVTSIEITYRTPSGELVGAGICDVTPNVLSSVYFYWHPAHGKRSLGWYSMLQEIELARRLGRRWYHLGYWVDGAPTMDYKRQIGPHELLGTDGVWRPADPAADPR